MLCVRVSPSFSLCVCVCVCVCERERERSRESVCGMQFSRLFSMFFSHLSVREILQRQSSSLRKWAPLASGRVVSPPHILGPAAAGGSSAALLISVNVAILNYMRGLSR